MFRTVIAWIYFWGVLARYPLYKLGLLSRPMWLHRFELSALAWGQMLRWKHRIRVVHPERCPQQHPAIFAANHVKLDDPFYVWRAVHIASNEQLMIRFMARDDYFAGPPWDYLPINVNELLEMGGTLLISRDNVSLAQLKPLMKVLEEPGSFVLFPGRTRSRSGLLFEYREGVEEPGAVSWFITQVQRRNPELRVAAAPLCRTHHPILNTSALVFGDPLYLKPAADRAAQRQLDFELTQRIGQLVEINAPHLVAGLLYLRALHRLPDCSLQDVIDAVSRMVERLREYAYLHPELTLEPEIAVGRTVNFFAAAGLLNINGPSIIINPSSILSTPALTTKFRKENPLQFQLNQILHLPYLIEALEAAVLTSRKDLAEAVA